MYNLLANPTLPNIHQKATSTKKKVETEHTNKSIGRPEYLEWNPRGGGARGQRILGAARAFSTVTLKVN